MKRLILPILILAIGTSLLAQKVTFDDVISVKFQNMGPIVENNQVKGYFFFYKVDKVDRKNRAYMLQILDENMKLVNKKKFIKSKHIQLTEAVYNNEAFLFSFINPKKKILELESFDKEMKKLGSRAYELDKWAMTQYQTQLSGSGKDMEEGSNKLIYPMGNKGFIRYNYKKNKKVGYELEFLSNNLSKSKSWTKGSSPTSKQMLMATFGDVSDKYLVSGITVKPKLLSNKNISFNLNVVDLENKKVLFEKEMKLGRYHYSFMNSFINDDQESIMVFCEYFGENDDIFKDKSKGLAVLQFDMSGKIIKKEHHSWVAAIKKKIGVDKKGRIESGGYVAFHNVMKTVDGHYYAVGEMYKKVADGVGIAAAALGGRGSLVKMSIRDMIIFDFNPDLSLNDVTVVEKRKSSVGLPQGASLMPPTLLSHYIRLYGGFDYAFTQMSKDNATFFSTYTAIEKEKGKKRNPYFGIISKTEGDDDYTMDRIDLKTEASRIYVNPAKPGYVLLTEYFKKEKKLESRLEKINY